MEMPYHIQVGQSLSQRDESKVKDIIHGCFLKVDRIYNHRNLNSELSLLNRHPANSPFDMSTDLETLLLLTDKIVKLSKGRFDPTYGSQWKQLLSNGQLPNLSEELGWDKIQIHDHTITKERQEIFLDLDGIAKGMSVDLLTEALQEAGFQNLYVEWSGEIKAMGTHPSGRDWNTMLPQNEIIHLQNESIASSGSDLQQWQVDAKIYTHIFNPITRQPLEVTENSVSNVTVKAPSCAIADGLATAGMLFDSLEDAEAWAQSIQLNHPEISIWFSNCGVDKIFTEI